MASLGLSIAKEKFTSGIQKFTGNTGDDGKTDDQTQKDEERKKIEEAFEEAELSDSEEHFRKLEVETGGDEFGNIPEDALIWCEEHFDGDRKYAKYYPYAKDRSAEDIQAMNQVREWSVTLRHIKYVNHSDEGDFFVTFNVGWDFKVTRKLRLPRTSGKVRRGELETDAATKTQHKPSWEWVRQGDQGTPYITHLEKNIKKGQSADFGNSPHFIWHGTYFDLLSKKLHVEVWSWNMFSTNEYLGMAEKELSEIAYGEMSLSGSEWEIKTERKKRKGRKEQIVLGALDFTCTFQERLRHVVKLQNWRCSLSPWHHIDPPEIGEQAVLDIYAKFKLERSSIIGPITIASVNSRGARLTIQMDEDDNDNLENQRFSFDLTCTKNLCFIGTRFELEEKTLQLILYRKGLFSSQVIGKSSIPLSGVVHDGYLASKLTWRSGDGDKCVPSSGTTSGVLRNVGLVSGSFEIECEELKPWPWAAMQGGGTALNVVMYPFKPILYTLQKRRHATLWREFAQRGDCIELRDYFPYNYSYLAVKIIEARNLLGADANGLSDPYITLSWQGQRLRTKIMEETVDPVYDETLYFHIRSYDPNNIKSDELISVPYVRLSVWDWDETGSSDFLGTAKLYLHWITGCNDDENFPVRRPERMTIRRRKNKFVNKYISQVIQTRIYRGQLRLEGLAPGQESYVKVEAWFRTPDGDLYENDSNTKARNGTDLLLLPNLQNQQRQRLATCLCYPNDAIEIKGNVAMRLTCKSSTTGVNICDTFSKFYDSLQDISRNRELKEYDPVEALGIPKTTLNMGTINPESKGFDDESYIYNRVKHLEMDFASHNFSVVNQFNERHFLPTYLHPVTPPKSMIDETEEPYMIIRSSQKPNSCYRAAMFIRSLPFEDYEGRDHLLEGAVSINKNTWLSPDFFLAMKKGDVKAHVLLLANIFLGLRTDAYVCLGYASKGKIKPNDQYLSKTPKSKAHDDDGDGEDILIPHLWVMTRESTSDSCLSTNTKEVANDHTYGGAVKFWEASLGTYYPALPNRWEGQNDSALYEQAKRRKKNIRTKNKKRSKVKKKRNTLSKFESKVGNSATYALQEPKEEDFIDNIQDSNLINSEEIFRLGAGIGDGFPTYEGGNLRKSSYRSLHDLLEDEKNKTEHDNNNIAPENGAVVTQVTNDAEQMTYKKVLEKHKERLKWIQKHVKRMKRLKKRHINLPYKSIVAAFNNNNLWVNVHDSCDPTKISYDLDRGVEFGWLPVIQGRTGHQRTHIESHYPSRSLGSMLSKEIISKLQCTVYYEIVSGLESFRNSRDMPTRIADERTNIPSLINDTLDAKYTYDLIDRSKANGWNPHEGLWEKGSVGYIKYATYVKRLRKLHATCLAGYRYRISFVKVHSSDPKEIRKVMLRHQREEASTAENERGIPIYEESHQGRETFAVGVKVIPLYGNLCNVWVGVMCMFPKGTDYEDDVSLTDRVNIS